MVARRLTGIKFQIDFQYEKAFLMQRPKDPIKGRKNREKHGVDKYAQNILTKPEENF